jgi:hypothetical protein
MRSLRPEELVLLLVFVVVPLLNLALRWLQQRGRKRAARPPEPAPGEARIPSPMPRVRVVEPSLPREGPAAPPRVPLSPQGRGQGEGRSLPPLGGPAALRRAIVVMTLLGPCRGLEERQAPRSPRE